jgi:DNA invertase Pin-like site-specific DNA recombinase
MTGKRYGYARVSSDDQDLTIQREQLVEHGCDVVLFEKASGKSREARPELEKIMSVIGKGDALVVTKFDRLGRNMLDMLMISEELKTKGANLVSLAEQIDTSTAMGNAFFQITGIFAEMERGRIRERQREGIERAKAAGVYKGRPPSIDYREIRRRAANGETPTAIAKAMGCARQTVYRALSPDVKSGQRSAKVSGGAFSSRARDDSKCGLRGTSADIGSV